MSTPIPSMTGGAGGGSSAGATGGMASAGGLKFDNSGMTVNYAPSVGVGGNSTWLMVGAAVIGVLLWRRRG